MSRTLRLDGDALVTLAPGDMPLRVAQGEVEVYLAGPERRRLIAVVGPGQHVFPIAPASAARLVAAAAMPAMLVADDGDLQASARAWTALHDGVGVLPAESDHLVRHIQRWTEGLGARFAQEETERDRRTALRLTTLDATASDDDAAAELGWLVEQSGGNIDTVRGPAAARPDDQGAQAVAFGARLQALTLESDWPRRDAGPLLLRTRSGAVRAAWWQRGNYRLRDGSRVELPDAFERSAHAVHLLGRLPRGVWGLARFVARDLLRDAAPQLFAGCGLAVLGLAMPVAAATLFDELIPSRETGLIVASGIALVAVTLFSALLRAVLGLAQARADGRGALRLAAAVGDHVLRLPCAFFRTLPAGDFNQRLAGLEAMQSLLIRVLGSAALTTVLAVNYFALLFAYDMRLALVGVLLTLFYIAAVLASRVLQVAPLRRAAQVEGKLTGLTYEMLDALPKLRAAAAEHRFLVRWADLYDRERRATAQGERVGNHFAAFAGGYDVLVPMALFATVAVLVAPGLSAGAFVAFLTTFGLFEAAFIGLSAHLLSLYAAQPLAERAQVVLDAQPEPRLGRADPGRLAGAIDVSGLLFGYDDATAPLIDRLDLSIAPGEHFAIVGGSGSGKSTLLRLLLGFEVPRAGSITYDGQELAHLDPALLRRQIGAVLQNSLLFSGTILDNVRGASAVGLGRCIEAARLAGLEPDLAAMGMGIHTPITEGGGTFSGGQKQRILIARAIAAQPRIMFLDEATSALDNATQAVVAATLDGLDATRITIAHRLSTVRRAHRIGVLQRGRFVEVGTFGELMARGGEFAVLARRQLLED